MTCRMRKTIVTLILAALSYLAEPTWAAVEYHMIQSSFTEDVGYPSEFELTVYLPPGYEESDDIYPLLWVHHGSAASVPRKNRAMFGDYALQFERTAAIQDVADNLLSEGKIAPMIMVGPAIPGSVTPAFEDVWGKYFYREIVPFIQSRYRVARTREHWGDFGISKGGSDGPVLVFKRPDLFRWVGIGAGATWFNKDQMTENYDQSKYPLDFWLWHGQNDPTVPFSTSELFEQWLIERGFDYTFVVTDGDHIDCIREPAFIAALQWFSARFQEAGTAVEAKGKLASSWAAMKTR
ncbi:MAG: hypothetical protein CMO43_01640 [Verrucomicrobiales bacterium]|nr:hypothetical protein [Verrucomicrobiales bacterium]